MMFRELHQPILDAENFTYGEALYLNRWNIYAIPNRQVLAEIEKLAIKLQKIRGILKKPMLITSWWRPEEYNKLIGGASQSWHITGGAADFRCPNISADRVREILVPVLDDFDIRMENLPGSNWVHVDTKDPVRNRYFLP